MTTTELRPPLTSEVAPLPRLVSPLPAALRSEWIKATTVRTNKVILGVAVVVGILSAWGPAVFIKSQVLTAAEVFVYPTGLTSVLATIAGVLVFTSEAHHGTLAAAVTAQPARWPIAAAKAAVAAGYGAVLGAIGVVAGFAGSLAGGLPIGATDGVVSTIGWALLYTSGSALLGLGVGMIVRHSAGAVAGVLVWAMVIESLILQFAPAEFVRFLPFDTGFRTLGVESDFDQPEVVAAGLSHVGHASIFWAYVAAAMAVGVVSFRRHDID